MQHVPQALLLKMALKFDFKFTKLLYCTWYITPFSIVHGTLRHWLAVITNRNKAFSIRHEGTHHEKVVQSSRMSYILICVRVALATSDVQSILDIPATDEIHMEDRNHGLA